MKNFTFWIVTILIIIGALLGLFFLATMGPEDGTPSGVLAVPVNEEDHSKGSDDALIVLVEYSDFLCPWCATLAPIMDGINNDFGDRVKIVFRHLPLVSLHPTAPLAAQATEAAAFQGKFWEMHDILFEKQESWGGLSEEETIEIFVAYAQDIGLDVDKFRVDLESEAVMVAVVEDIQGAQRGGLTGTPSVYFNDQLLELETMEDIRNVVEEAINILDQQ